jgi:hypothetical protein
MASAGCVFHSGRGIAFAVHDAEAPTDEEWVEFLRHGREVFEKVPNVVDCTSLAITDGGGPNAKQRKQVVEQVRSFSNDRVDRINSSVISENLLVRGVVGALALFVPGVRIFTPDAFGAAFKHIGVPPTEWPVIADEVEKLAASVPRARAARTLVHAIRREVRATP